MKYVVIFDVENAAFEPDPEPEIVRILLKLAGDTEQGTSAQRTLFDVNGNKVGQAGFADDALVDWRTTL
jgi:hypothetical protein